jgi:hypothetical protein
MAFSTWHFLPSIDSETSESDWHGFDTRKLIIRFNIQDVTKILRDSTELISPVSKSQTVFDGNCNCPLCEIIIVWFVADPAEEQSITDSSHIMISHHFVL